MLIFLLIQATQQIEEIYLKNEESILTSTFNLFVDSINYQQNDFVLNNQVAIIADEFKLTKCNLDSIDQSLISIKFNSYQYLETEIFYVSNLSDVYCFQRLIQENSCLKKNNLFKFNIVTNYFFKYSLPFQVCYDHLFDNKDSTLIIVCYSLNQQKLKIKKYFQKQFVDEITLNENINQNCSHKLGRLSDNYYLVSCLGTIDWAVYKFQFLENSSYSNVLDIKRFNDYGKGTIMNEFRIGKSQLYLFQEQYVCIIKPPEIIVYYFKKILFFDIVQGDALIQASEGVVNIDKETKIYSLNSTNNYTLNQLLEQKALHCLSVSPISIFYNESHLFVNNLYTKINIQHINYWEKNENYNLSQSCQFEIISIFSNQSIYLYQLLDIQEVIQMQGKAISYSNQNKDNLFLLNIDQNQVEKIHKISTQIRDIYSIGYQQWQIFKKQFPIIKFSHQISGEQLQTNISTRVEQIQYNEQVIQNDKLISLSIDNESERWIFSNNSSLYMITCITKDNCTKQLIIQYQEKYEKLFHLKYQQQSSQYLLIVIQNMASFDLTIYKYMGEVKGKKFNFTEILISIIKHKEENKFYIKTRENYYIYDIEYQSLNLDNNIQNQGQIIINNCSLFILENFLYLSKTINISNILNQFDTGLQNIIHWEILIMHFNQFLLICQSNQQITYIQHYFIDKYYSMVLLKTIAIEEYIVLYPYIIQQINQYIFTFEALNQKDNQTYILLYNFQYPSLYCLRYYTIRLSDVYILENNGNLVFLFDNRMEIIFYDQLIIEQYVAPFNIKQNIRSYISIQLENPYLNLTLMIDIKYFEYLLDIIVPNSKRIIPYKSNESHYKLPIEKWSQGIIENISLSNNQYSIFPPFKQFFELTVSAKQLIVIKDNYFLYKISNSQFQFVKLEYIPYKSDPIFTPLHVFEDDQIQVYLKMSKLQINQRIFIIRFNITQETHCQCVFYELDQDKNKFNFFGTLNIDQEIANDMQIINDHYILFSYNAFLILYDLNIVNNSIQVINSKQFNTINYTKHFEQNRLYFSKPSKYELQIYKISQENMMLENIFNITYPQNDQEKFTNYNIYNITDNSALVLIRQKSNYILVVQYQVQGNKYKYLYLKKPYKTISQSTYILSNLILIEYFSNQVPIYFVYSIFDQDNQGIVYPCQRIRDSIKEIIKLSKSIYIIWRINSGYVAQVNEEYSIEINEVKETNFDIILSNQSNSQSINIILVRSKIPYLWIIVIHGFFLQLYLNLMKIN